MNTPLFLHIVAWGVLIPAGILLVIAVIDALKTKDGSVMGYGFYLFYLFALVSLAYLIAS